MNLREGFFKWFFTYQHVQVYISLINFLILLVLISDKVEGSLGIKMQGFAFVFVPLAVVSLLAFGWFMVKVVRAPEMLEKQSLENTVYGRELMKKVDELKKNG